MAISRSDATWMLAKHLTMNPAISRMLPHSSTWLATAAIAKMLSHDKVGRGC